MKIGLCVQLVRRLNGLNAGADKEGLKATLTKLFQTLNQVAIVLESLQ